MTISIKQTRYYWMKAYTHINGVKMTAVDKVVFESLHAFASTTERVSPSVAYLSAINGLSATAVKGSLKRLEDAKLLFKTKNGNRANSYEINLAELMKLNDGYREMIEAAQEEAAAGKAERMAKLVKAPVVAEAITASKHCIDAVLAILRKMTGAETEEERLAPEPLAKPVVAPVPKWQKLMKAPTQPAAHDEDEPDWWSTSVKAAYNEEAEPW